MPDAVDPPRPAPFAVDHDVVPPTVHSQSLPALRQQLAAVVADPGAVSRDAPRSAQDALRRRAVFLLYLYTVPYGGLLTTHVGPRGSLQDVEAAKEADLDRVWEASWRVTLDAVAPRGDVHGQQPAPAVSRTGHAASSGAQFDTLDDRDVAHRIARRVARGDAEDAPRADSDPPTPASASDPRALHEVFDVDNPAAAGAHARQRLQAWRPRTLASRSAPLRAHPASARATPGAGNNGVLSAPRAVAQPRRPADHDPTAGDGFIMVRDADYVRNQDSRPAWPDTGTHVGTAEYFSELGRAFHEAPMRDAMHAQVHRLVKTLVRAAMPPDVQAPTLCMLCKQRAAYYQHRHPPRDGGAAPGDSRMSLHTLPRPTACHECVVCSGRAMPGMLHDATRGTFACGDALDELLSLRWWCLDTCAVVAASTAHPNPVVAWLLRTAPLTQYALAAFPTPHCPQAVACLAAAVRHSSHGAHQYTPAVVRMDSAALPSAHAVTNGSVYTPMLRVHSAGQMRAACEQRGVDRAPMPVVYDGVALALGARCVAARIARRKEAERAAAARRGRYRAPADGAAPTAVLRARVHDAVQLAVADGAAPSPLDLSPRVHQATRNCVLRAVEVGALSRDDAARVSATLPARLWGVSTPGDAADFMLRTRVFTRRLRGSPQDVAALLPVYAATLELMLQDALHSKTAFSVQGLLRAAAALPRPSVVQHPGARANVLHALGAMSAYMPMSSALGALVLRVETMHRAQECMAMWVDVSHGDRMADEERAAVERATETHALQWMAAAAMHRLERRAGGFEAAARALHTALPALPKTVCVALSGQAWRGAPQEGSARDEAHTARFPRPYMALYALPNVAYADPPRFVNTTHDALWAERRQFSGRMDTAAFDGAVAAHAAAVAAAVAACDGPNDAVEDMARRLERFDAPTLQRAHNMLRQGVVRLSRNGRVLRHLAQVLRQRGTSAGKTARQHDAYSNAGSAVAREAGAAGDRGAAAGVAGQLRAALRSSSRPPSSKRRP